MNGGRSERSEVPDVLLRRPFLLLVALLVAVIPAWPYSRRWGYTPTAAALVVLLGFLVLSYIGYIGPWEQAGPPFHLEEVADPDLEPGSPAAD